MTQRQEPVLNTGAAPVLKLTDRINLSWTEILGLTRSAEAHVAPTVVPVTEVTTATPATSASQAVTVPTSADAMPHPFELELTDEEKKAIAARLAPLVERAVREGLRDAIDFSLSNAVSRMKGDLERSVSALVTRAVDREVQNLRLSDFVKR